MDNYCGSSLIAAFGFKTGDSVLLMEPPLNYLETLRCSDSALNISTHSDSSGPFDAVHVFVLNQVDVMELAPAAPAVLKKDGRLWFSFPNIEADKPTDISYEVGWQTMTDSGWSVFQTTNQLTGWSSLRFIESEK